MPTALLVTDCPDIERLIAELIPREAIKLLIVGDDPHEVLSRARDTLILTSAPTRRGLPEGGAECAAPVYVRPALVPLLPEDDGGEDDTDLWQEYGGSD